MAQYIQSYPTLSEAAYNNLFRYQNPTNRPTNPLVGQYQTVTDAANRAGIPPSLLAAIMAQETGFGRYNERQTGGGRIYTHNNPAGLMDPATNHSTPLRYNTFQEGLDAAARTAARIYNRGGTVLPTIQNIYAPTDPQPANDPNRLNRHWLPNVTNFLRNIAGTMSPADYEALLPNLQFDTTPDVIHQEGTNVGPPGGMGYLGGNDFLQSVEERSAAAGYQLPAGVAELLQRTAPSLAAGPEGFAAGNFPWFTPGAIGQDVGGILQHHALMPNNLVYNPSTYMWEVPNERRFPSGTGIWSQNNITQMLPDMPEGFARGYLEHLGYGQPEQMTPYHGATLSPGYYGAPNTYGVPPSGQLTDMMGNMTGGNLTGNSYVNQNFGFPIGSIGTGVGISNETLQQYLATLGIGNQGYPGLPPPGTYSGPGRGDPPPEGTYTPESLGSSPGGPPPAASLGYYVTDPRGGSGHFQPQMPTTSPPPMQYNPSGGVTNYNIPLAAGPVPSGLMQTMGPGGIPLATGVTISPLTGQYTTIGY